MNLQKAIEGDRDALGMLLEEFQPVIRRYLMKRTDWHTADDVWGEVCRTVTRNFKTLPTRKGAFRHWLFCVARCRLVDALRKEKKHQLGRVEADLEKLHRDTPPCDFDGDLLTAWLETGGRIVETAQRLGISYWKLKKRLKVNYG